MNISALYAYFMSKPTMKINIYDCYFALSNIKRGEIAVADTQTDKQGYNQTD